MSLTEQLKDDLKNAMRAGDVGRRAVLRYLLSEIHNQEIARQRELKDEDLFDLLSKQAQQRRDSIEAFTNGKREDLVAKEEVELEIIIAYLPKQLSDDEIDELVLAAISESGASGTQDIGKVMSLLMPRVKGIAQGSVVSAMVSEKLRSQGN